MKNIMFLCTGNSCRSQMAEGLCRSIWGSELNAYSAGTKKHGMNKRAILVMKEIGIDISEQYSKTTEELPTMIFDYVINVCDSAHQYCPFYPGTLFKHVGFKDPPALTKEMTNEEEILSIYRLVRDDIHQFMKDLKVHIP
jgi:arsenate reductase